MKPIRQGDVLLIPAQPIQGKSLNHLTLALGEVTGHSHRISDGNAELIGSIPLFKIPREKIISMTQPSLCLASGDIIL